MTDVTLNTSTWGSLLMLVTALSGATLKAQGIKPAQSRLTSSLQPFNRMCVGQMGVSAPDAAQQIRIQVDLIETLPSQQHATQLVVYSLQIENFGQRDFSFVPAIQVFISDVNGQVNIWHPSRLASAEAGINAPNCREIVTVKRGDTRRMQLAAHVLSGEVRAISFVLDPFAADLGQLNVAHWLVELSR